MGGAERAMTEVRIGGAARESLVVQIAARERPQSMDDWDGNWLHASVEVHAGGFDGRASGAIRAQELVVFRDDVAALARSLRGRATFSTMEDWLAIEMTGDGRGHVEVTGRLHDDPGSVNRLMFRLEVDQTHLSHVLAALDDVVTRFPVRGRPEGGPLSRP
jgi:hypothetical protein